MTDYNSLPIVSSPNQIEIGDFVWIEITSDGNPRWDRNTDRIIDYEETAGWREHEVIRITNDKFYVRVIGQGDWYFPFCYADGNPPGWPRLIIKIAKNTCTCSITVVCNLGCPSNRGLKCPSRQEV